MALTWANVRKKGLRTAMSVNVLGKQNSVINEAKQQTLKYGRRKALGAVRPIHFV